MLKKISQWLKRNNAEFFFIVAFLIAVVTTAALNIYLAGYLTAVFFFLEGISIASAKKGGSE